MTSSALALPVRGDRARCAQHPLVERYAPIATIVLALIAIWYVAAVLMNLSLVRDAFEREETPYTRHRRLIAGTMSAERPLLPAPHQVIARLCRFGFRLSADWRRAAWSIIRWSRCRRRCSASSSARCSESGWR